jgi:hypothetical protein
MPAHGPIHDVIPQFYTAGATTADLRHISVRSMNSDVPQAQVRCQSRQGSASPASELLSSECGIRGLGVRETLR